MHIFKRQGYLLSIDFVTQLVEYHPFKVGVQGSSPCGVTYTHSSMDRTTGYEPVS